MSGGMGVSVSGGTGVLVSVGTGVFVGIGVRVLVGMGVSVGCGMGVFVMGSGRGRRVLVGPPKVGNGKLKGVFDTVEVGPIVKVDVGGRVGVDVASSSENACRVIAAAVFKFETTESKTSAGSRAMAVAIFKSCSAIRETEQSRLMPMAPAKKTQKSPR